MNFLPLLESKRDGAALSAAQLGDMIRNYVAGRIPDYQMSAFLMAVFFRGLNKAETTALTLAMRDSGERLEFPGDSRPLVDKHSTGGVGDKVSLPLAPLLAALGFRVPMISGRGLGITGGTLDKLDSIPDFKTLLPKAEIVECVQQVGCAICGQTESMVPADKALYALRDVTGTVASVPLIVASILSKKLAEGLSALILDVKFGTAAFMGDAAKARQLARAMVDLGNACGVRTRALLTRMDTPLGHAVGNWLEIRETVACLEGRGPQDVMQLVYEAAAHLLVQTEKTRSLEEGREIARACLVSGAAHKRWDAMLLAQGANLDAFEKKLSSAHDPAASVDVKAPQSGFVISCDAKQVGEAVRALGGGRLTKSSVLDYDAGVEILKKPGHQVWAGEAIARICGPDTKGVEEGAVRVAAAFGFDNAPPSLEPLIAGVLE